LSLQQPFARYQGGQNFRGTLTVRDARGAGGD
jgi:hypothetical protein